MEAVIDGETVTVPPCTCGKCIIRRVRKNFFTPIPYSKNLGSTYTKDYDWKTSKGDPEFYNRSKHNGFEGCYKEHLPTSLMSTSKLDYKPFKVKLEEKVKEPVKIQSSPFFGRTTYATAFPDWGAMTPSESQNANIPEIKIPLRGNSNYAENYVKYDPKFYKPRDPLDFAKGTLEFYGKLNPDTTYKSAFKPIDLNQPQYFSKANPKGTQFSSPDFIPAELPPNNFQSSYGNSFVDYEDQKCKLAEYLRKRGMKHLEI